MARRLPSYNPFRRARLLRAASALVALLMTGSLACRLFSQEVPAVASTNAVPPASVPDTNAASVSSSALTNLTPATLNAMMQPPAAVYADTSMAPEPGTLPTPGVVSSKAPGADVTKTFQSQLEEARKYRGEKSTDIAVKILTDLLKTNAPLELKRPVLFELALVVQDAGQLAKAEQIFAQYLQTYLDDPSTPEILLRQGLIYRQMGVNSLAISKFYAVMSTALKLKLENMDYYKKLVLEAQIEIADTYYLEGKYNEAADYFTRLLKNPPPDLDRAQIEYKLIRSLSGLTNDTETVAHGEVFLETHPDSQDLPEVRFLLATALKKLGRNQDALKQVLMLLQSQRENVQKNPEVWAYWQRRAGTEIASQLFKEGDYLDALEIDLSLADLDKSAEWQLPVWYQTALVYEQLQQWPKATKMYQQIVDRQKELPDSARTPSLLSLFEMAGWRKDYIAWLEKAKTTDQMNLSSATNRPPAAPVAAQ